MQQLTLVSTILLGFSFLTLVQLLRFRHEEGTGTSTARLISATVVLFILGAQTMLVSTIIGVALTLILGYYRSGRAGPIPEEIDLITSTLFGFWGFPLLGGLLLFLAGCGVLIWIRSRIFGIVSLFGIIATAILTLIAWGLLGRL